MSNDGFVFVVIALIVGGLIGYNAETEKAQDSIEKLKNLTITYVQLNENHNKLKQDYLLLEENSRKLSEENTKLKAEQKQLLQEIAKYLAKETIIDVFTLKKYGMLIDLGGIYFCSNDPKLPFC